MHLNNEENGIIETKEEKSTEGKEMRGNNIK